MILDGEQNRAERVDVSSSTGPKILHGLLRNLEPNGTEPISRAKAGELVKGKTLNDVTAIDVEFGVGTVYHLLKVVLTRQNDYKATVLDRHPDFLK